MFTIIWKKSGSLRGQLDSLITNIKSVRSNIEEAETGTVLAIESLATELGTIRGLKTELANIGA